MKESRRLLVIGAKLTPGDESLADLIEFVEIGGAERPHHRAVVNHGDSEIHCVEQKRLDRSESLVGDEHRLVSHQIGQSNAGHHRPANIRHREISRDVRLEELVLGRRFAVVDRESNGIARFAYLADDTEGKDAVAAVAEIALYDACAPGQ